MFWFHNIDYANQRAVDDGKPAPTFTVVINGSTGVVDASELLRAWKPPATAEARAAQYWA